MSQDAVPGLRLGLLNRLVRFQQLLEIVDAGGQRINISLRRADPQHVQDDLCVFGIVFVPPVGQRFPGSGQRYRGDQPQLQACRQKPVSERAMIVAGRLEADEDRLSDRGKLCRRPGSPCLKTSR